MKTPMILRHIVSYASKPFRLKFLWSCSYICSRADHARAELQTWEQDKQPYIPDRNTLDLLPNVGALQAA